MAEMQKQNMYGNNAQPLSSTLGRELVHRSKYARAEQQQWADNNSQNALGQPVSVPKGSTYQTVRGNAKPIAPNNKLQASGAQTKIVRVIYGHGNPNGKMSKAYDYLASKNVQTGDIITPPVNHAVSGKLYNTLAKVISTQSASGEGGQNISANLAGKGIMLKNIGRTNQRMLPNYYTGWGHDAKARDDALMQARANNDKADYALTKQASDNVRAERKQAYERRKEQRMQKQSKLY